jgi:SAM-dependent methyltransferase
MISRQLDRHMPEHPARVLDVGAGQGTQSIRLARAGHHVLAVEPDPDMRAAFGAALGTEPGQVRDRVVLREGSVGSLRYVNEIGTPARADDLETLTAAAAAAGLELESWYGVRIAVDLEELDPAPPSDPAELAALLDVEERLGATDPYRQLGQLAHLILRKADTATTSGE